MKKVNILGTEYEIKMGTYKDFPALSNMDGYTDTSTQTIVVDDMSMAEGEIDSKGNLEFYRKSVIRHEIIHAFLHESGLASNSVNSDNWAVNEEMVDWFAIQSPKIFKVFQELDIL